MRIAVFLDFTRHHLLLRDQDRVGSAFFGFAFEFGQKAVAADVLRVAGSGRLAEHPVGLSDPGRVGVDLHMGGRLGLPDPFILVRDAPCRQKQHGET